MVRVHTRELGLLFAVKLGNVALPLPLADAVIVSHAALLEALYAQAGLDAVKPTVPIPAAPDTAALVEESEKVHTTAYVAVTVVGPDMVRVCGLAVPDRVPLKPVKL